jgi:prepilin-type N-terminal cleavage/methylation domain-containing protein
MCIDMSSRRRPGGGFTLVELMIVIAMVSVVGALAARIYSRGVRGEAAPAFARSLLSTILEARHAAMSMGRASRVTLVPGSSGSRVVVDLWEPSTSSWVTQMTTAVPSGVSLCRPDASVQLGTVTPTCPLTSGMSNTVCFTSTSRVTVTASPSGCPTTATSTATGATLYFVTTAGDKKYRVVIWGLTGMAKLMDTW